MIYREFFSGFSSTESISQDAGRPTVLVVDDCSIIRSLLHLVLSQSGFQVLLAESGPEALAQCRSFGGAIDLILCDTSMKPWDGVHTVRQMRKAELTIPFAFMTGAGSGRSPDEVEAEKPLGVFAKPLSLPDLVTRVHRLVREQRNKVAV